MRDAADSDEQLSQVSALAKNAELYNRFSLPAALLKQSPLIDARTRGAKNRRATVILNRPDTSTGGDYEENPRDRVPFYSQLLFQQHKRRYSYGQKEPGLHDTGEIHTFKRQILTSAHMRIEDTGADRKAERKATAVKLGKFKAGKRRDLEKELKELMNLDGEQTAAISEAFNMK